jgi:putative transcriptional regulator
MQCQEETAMKNKKIKIARIECDLSQEQLAEKVGVTRQTIGLIESGNYNPTLKLCIEICKALNKTLNDLFWEG